VQCKRQVRHVRNDRLRNGVRLHRSARRVRDGRRLHVPSGNLLRQVQGERRLSDKLHVRPEHQLVLRDRMLVRRRVRHLLG
jgi:hypothetical protein